MGLILIAHESARAILLLLLIPALLLTVWEVRERGFESKVAWWWVSLVFLIHIPGYLALRVWGYRLDRQQQ